MNDQFYLTLPSNSSTVYYPDNTVANYKTQLSRAVQLPGVWEVAVVEVHFPCSFLTVDNDATVFVYKTNHRDRREANAKADAKADANADASLVSAPVLTRKIPHIFKQTKILSDDIPSQDKLMSSQHPEHHQVLLRKFSSNLPDGNTPLPPPTSPTPSQQPSDIPPPPIRKSTEEEEEGEPLILGGVKVYGKRIFSQPPKVDAVKKPVDNIPTIVSAKLTPGNYTSVGEIIDALNSHERLVDVVSFEYDSKKVQIIFKETIDQIEMSHRLALILGFDPREADLKKNNVSIRPANVLLGLPSQMYVYCDIVEPQLIGDTMAPLLQIINIDTISYVYGANKYVQFSTPHYVPLMKSSFENLEIDLRDHTGAHLPFHFGTSCVKLHFRKSSGL